MCSTRESVRRHYARYVTSGGDGPSVLSDRGSDLGYDGRYLESCGIDPAVASALFSASCGSGCPPRLPRGPRVGEVVVDMGCGGGHDVVIASRIVGAGGEVIGVDMTGEMIDAAAENVRLCLDGGRCGKVTLLKAAIDDPSEMDRVLGKGIADVVMSNGVFNLCADKGAAFAAAYRVLKPGGRFLLSDLCRVEEQERAAVSCSVGDGWSS